MALRADQLVVLLPGLWMPAAVMQPLAWRLQGCGYRTTLFGYPSMRAGLAENAQRLASFVAAQSADKLYLVGHSLGGIVIMKLLEMHAHPRIVRAVLLAPPYGECSAARALARSAPGRALLGASIPEWLAGQRPRAMNGSTQIGVIAGSRSIGLGRLVARGMPRPNDGVVTVEESRVPGMREHIVLRVSHSAMLFSSQLAHQTCEFLRCGAFLHRPG